MVGLCMALRRVAKLIALCLCSSLYQRTSSVTQRLACIKSANGLSGNCGRYFKVLNSDSEYGLSLLTAARLRR